VQAIAGRGIGGIVDARVLRLGSERLMRELVDRLRKEASIVVNRPAVAKLTV